MVPIRQHIYPEETNGEKVNESDVYVNFLPLVLMTMNNYLQDVADKKIAGDKFKDLQKSAEAYYNSRAPELKQVELLVFPTAYIINKNVTAEKITEKFPYKSRIISFDEYIKAVPVLSGYMQDKFLLKKELEVLATIKSTSPENFRGSKKVRYYKLLFLIQQLFLHHLIAHHYSHNIPT